MGDFYYNNGIYDFESGSKFNSYNFSTSKFTIYFWLKFKPEFCNSDGSIVSNKVYIGMEDGNVYTCEIPNDTKAHHYCLERDGNKTIYFFIDGKLKLMEDKEKLYLIQMVLILLQGIKRKFSLYPFG